VIHRVRASVWYNEEETVATCYIQVDDKKDKIAMTFHYSNFNDDGVGTATRIRSQSTKTPIDGVSATLEVPYEEDEEPIWQLTITFEGQDPITISMPRDIESIGEDGMPRRNRPRASGAWTAVQNVISIHDWLQFDGAETIQPTIVKPLTPSIEKIRKALGRKGTR
jgi:hypothetical protein